jgi:hypothetical protein
MGTVIHFENDIAVSKELSLTDEPVKAAAFYDLFDHAEKLEDFVRELAGGKIADPVSAANQMMDLLNFG